MVPAAHTDFRDCVLARRVTFLLRVTTQVFVVVLQEQQNLAVVSFAVKLIFSFDTTSWMYTHVVSVAFPASFARGEVRIKLVTS